MRTKRQIFILDKRLLSETQIYEVIFTFNMHFDYSMKDIRQVMKLMCLI